jgi:hypothetical protein
LQALWGNQGTLFDFSGTTLEWFPNVNTTVVTASSGIGTGTWHFIAVTQDASNNWAMYVDGISINSGTTVSMLTQSQPASLGAYSAGPSRFFDGAIDDAALYSRALSQGEVTGLYNGGAGKNYSSLTSSDKVGLVSFWLLNEATGATRADSHGSNNLSDHNSVAQVTGIVEDSLFPGEDEERPVLQTQSRRWFLPLSFAEEIMPLLEGPGIITGTHARVGHGPRILAKLSTAPRIRARLVLEPQK